MTFAFKKQVQKYILQTEYQLNSFKMQAIYHFQLYVSLKEQHRLDPYAMPY